MSLDLNLTELIKFILEKYGLVGFALMFWVWNGVQVQRKIDHLATLNNKMFGIMLSIADRRICPFSNGRRQMEDNGGSFDDRSYSD